MLYGCGRIRTSLRCITTFEKQCSVASGQSSGRSGKPPGLFFWPARNRLFGLKLDALSFWNVQKLRLGAARASR